MKDSLKMWVGITLIVVAVAGAAYLVQQYRASQIALSLSDIPENSSPGFSYPFTDLSTQEQDRVRTTFRTFVSEAQPDYHIVDERYMALKSATLGGAALKHGFENYLYRGSRYPIVGQFSNTDASPIYYLAGTRPSRLQRLFNDKATAIAVSREPIRDTPPSGKVYVYAYFTLAPN